LELLPLWVAVPVIETLPVSDSCPTALVTWAMAGAATTSTSASIATSIINFLNFFSFSFVI
jgi:hypothetical protein